MSSGLQSFWGISFLIISICILVFLLISILCKIDLPIYIQDYFIEIVVIAVLLIMLSLVLIFHK